MKLLRFLIKISYKIVLKKWFSEAFFPFLKELIASRESVLKFFFAKVVVMEYFLRKSFSFFNPFIGGCCCSFTTIQSGNKCILFGNSLGKVIFYVRPQKRAKIIIRNRRIQKRGSWCLLTTKACTETINTSLVLRLGKAI